MKVTSLCKTNNSQFSNYWLLEFNEGDTLIIVSASISNSYLLFGFLETEETKEKLYDEVDCYAIESTTVKPLY